jgi:uncharacterized membrane protein YedE/YeeE
MRLFPYLLVGALFGVVLTKGEMISWFRMQEMFRFQAFHMYGIVCSAIAVAAVGIAIIKKSQVQSMGGGQIDLPPKELGRGMRYVLGGTVFGLGWGLSGVCPGPIFALIGNGISVALVILASALVGARLYAAVRDRLPH